jgi:class 3 adenylate cyclase/pimeloyl-ACP methyl ester carboxylesterase
MSDFVLPPTRYAQSGDVSIAYQVWGEGPTDLVLVPGAVSHIEALHELPGFTAFMRKASGFARLIVFDKRGQGLSDRMGVDASLEERMDDIRAVMDAAGSERATIAGFSDGGALSVLFTTTYPERVTGLILCGGFVTGARRNMGAEAHDAVIEKMTKAWGTGAFVKRATAHSQTVSPEMMALFGKVERAFSSPGALKIYVRLNGDIDTSALLSSVRVPTLVMNRRTDAIMPIESGRAIAKGIPGARFIEYPDGDHGFWTGDFDTLLGDIAEFVTGHRGEAADLDRILATVMFTDIAGSTQSAVDLGDQRWRQLLDEHDRLGRQAIERHRGKLIKTTGDGLLATFDGPGRAVRCALAFRSAAKDIGLPVRAGLHTGEIELRGSDVGGVAVHAAARVMNQSQPGEVLVSRVVTDLVAGTGLRFEDRGAHELKGLPGRWELYAAS